MAYVNFGRRNTRLEALASKNKDKVFFPTDATSIILGGKEYGTGFPGEPIDIQILIDTPTFIDKKTVVEFNKAGISEKLKTCTVRSAHALEHGLFLYYLSEYLQKELWIEYSDIEKFNGLYYRLFRYTVDLQNPPTYICTFLFQEEDFNNPKIVTEDCNFSCYFESINELVNHYTLLREDGVTTKTIDSGDIEYTLEFFKENYISIEHDAWRELTTVKAGLQDLDLNIFEVVASLPTSDIKENKVYLVPNANSEDIENVYTEYKRVGDTWEKIGEYKSLINVTDYATKAELETYEEIAATALADLNNKLETHEEVSAAAFASLNNKISNLDLNIFELVTTLPTSDINENKIYLVPSSVTGTNNIYTEYKRVNNAWEKLGEYKSDVDLTEYIKEEDLFEEVEGYDANGHEYVDLGLPSGTLWATENVSSNGVEHFAWGDPQEKSTFNWSTYPDNPSGDGQTFIKYSLGGKTELDLEDDPANVYFGGGWRSPSYKQMLELMINCTEIWKDNGCEVVGPNGNKIFLPAAGAYIDGSLVDVGSCGSYWSRSLQSNYEIRSDSAHGVNFYLEGHSYGYVTRRDGYSVRPVLEKSTVKKIKDELLLGYAKSEDIPTKESWNYDDRYAELQENVEIDLVNLLLWNEGFITNEAHFNSVPSGGLINGSYNHKYSNPIALNIGDKLLFNSPVGAVATNAAIYSDFNADASSFVRYASNEEIISESGLYFRGCYDTREEHSFIIKRSSSEKVWEAIARLNLAESNFVSKTGNTVITNNSELKLENIGSQAPSAIKFHLSPDNSLNWTSEIVADYWGNNYNTTTGWTHGMYFVSGRLDFDNFIFLKNDKTPLFRIDKTGGFAATGESTINDNKVLHTGAQTLTDAEKTLVKENLGIESLPTIDYSNCEPLENGSFRIINCNSLDFKLQMTWEGNLFKTECVYNLYGKYIKIFKLARHLSLDSCYMCAVSREEVGLEGYLLLAAVVATHNGYAEILNIKDNVIEDISDTYYGEILSDMLVEQTINCPEIPELRFESQSPNAILIPGAQIIHTVPITQLNFNIPELFSNGGGVNASQEGIVIFTAGNSIESLGIPDEAECIGDFSFTAEKKYVVTYKAGVIIIKEIN